MTTTRQEPWLHVVLHEPEIPQNTGNVGRTCLAVAARLWLVRPLGFQLDERSLRRAGLDYWRHVDCQVRDGWPEVKAELGSRRHWYFTRFAERDFFEARFTPGDVLVFGSESNGLPRSMTEADPRQCLRIPVRPPIRSLNLASAVAVGVFEAWRQCHRDAGQ